MFYYSELKLNSFMVEANHHNLLVLLTKKNKINVVFWTFFPILSIRKHKSSLNRLETGNASPLRTLNSA